MKATLKYRVIAESDDIVEEGGYHYFPNAHVRVDLLEKSEKTAFDRECPHGVQFYDVVVDGARHERAAWRPSMRHVADRFDLARRRGRLTRYSHTGSFSSAASAVRRASSSDTKASWESLP